jgi:hypothetical protein
MGGKSLSKSKREGLIAGTLQPQNPKEASYLANQLAKREAGGRLPVTREQIELDRHHANMRRAAQAQRAEAPRNDSFHGESSRQEYRPHGRTLSPSYLGPLVSERDDLRPRMPERTIFDRDPRHDSRDAGRNRQDLNQGRSTAGHSYGPRGNSYPERVIYERVTYEYRDSGYDGPPPLFIQRPEPCIVRTHTVLTGVMTEGKEAARRRVVAALSRDACKMV